MIKKILIPLLLTYIFLLSACVAPHRAYKNGSGYLVLDAGNNHYRIEYYAKHAKTAEDFWKITAQQLCTNVEVIYSKTEILQFDMYTPIMGNNVNLGRQEHIQYGEVYCPQGIVSHIPLTVSPWYAFSNETKAVKPVSDEFIFQVHKIYLGQLINSSVNDARTFLTKKWGKPLDVIQDGNETASIWRAGGDNWLPNQVVLNEKANCLRLVTIVPGISTYLLSINSKKDENSDKKIDIKRLEWVLTEGIVPAYFYRPDSKNCDKINP